MILQGYKTNFETLVRAVKADHVCILECQDKATGKDVVTLCAVQVVDGMYEFVPLAKLFNGNPYEELNPPDPNGGFVKE